MQDGRGRVIARGLSPLARGNHTVDSIKSYEGGPIPACAGQPALASISTRSVTAYPRLRGATASTASTASTGEGLSPLARGNQCTGCAGDVDSGPIPACAGQPGCRRHFPGRCWAYPRLRGATDACGFASQDGLGLSPLARGNPEQESRVLLLSRPIPACAGQPEKSNRPKPFFAAYPRLRGATSVAMYQARCPAGLSPLARGNLHPRYRAGEFIGKRTVIPPLRAAA